MPAAHIALERAGLSFADVDAITMHDPFAVNDLLTRDHAFRLLPFAGSLVQELRSAPSSAVLGPRLTDREDAAGDGLSVPPATELRQYMMR